MSLELSIEPELAGLLRLGVFVLEGVGVKPNDPVLKQEIEAYSADLRRRVGDGRSGEVPGAEDARNLYKALGIDPTKTRPSSEALLRRVLKGELTPINSLVDALNLCSLRYQLPFGLYDLDRILPPLQLRRGRGGETYEGIRKGVVHLDGRPTLADAKGPFGNPTSDSVRTMISLETRSAMVALYAPKSRTKEQVEGVLGGCEATLVRFCGGSQTARLVF